MRGWFLSFREVVSSRLSVCHNNNIIIGKRYKFVGVLVSKSVLKGCRRTNLTQFVQTPMIWRERQ